MVTAGLGGVESSQQPRPKALELKERSRQPMGYSFTWQLQVPICSFGRHSRCIEDRTHILMVRAPFCMAMTPCLLDSMPSTRSLTQCESR